MHCCSETYVPLYLACPVAYGEIWRQLQGLLICGVAGKDAGGPRSGQEGTARRQEGHRRRRLGSTIGRPAAELERWWGSATGAGK